jgi:pyruvate/2-oxoglutarate dehydrogenase complex dihydrolipoamide acyltransferase (E2) component
MSDLRMPPLGQTTDELKVVRWLAEVNATVTAGDEVVLIETEKATLAVESPFSGILLEIVAPPGATVGAGDVLARIDDGRAASETEGDARTQFETAHSGDARRAHPPPCSGVRGVDVRVTRPAGKVLASPAARRLAAERGVDLCAVRGSGPDGRIESDDVRGHADGTA